MIEFGAFSNGRELSISIRCVCNYKTEGKKVLAQENLCQFYLATITIMLSKRIKKWSPGIMRLQVIRSIRECEF